MNNLARVTIKHTGPKPLNETYALDVRMDAQDALKVMTYAMQLISFRTSQAGLHGLTEHSEKDDLDVITKSLKEATRGK